jgi:hypothetical protein
MTEKIIKKYENLLKNFITDQDLKRYGLINDLSDVIKYSDLQKYNTMLELLPKENDYKVILTETKPNSGHWVCLLRYGNCIEFFDSYGVSPDGELKFIDKITRKLLGEDKKELTRLFNTLPEDYMGIYNKKHFQSLKNNINTCGRFVICRCLTSQFGYKLDEFIDLLEKQKKETGKPYDIIMCDWIE